MVVVGIEDFTPDYLTERLHASGTLSSGRVTAVRAGESRTTIVSTIVPFRLEYSADAPPEAPTRLVLKGSRSGLDAALRAAGEREVAFYRQAAALTPEGLLPRCYDTELAAESFYVLLEDLSDTHMILTVCSRQRGPSPRRGAHRRHDQGARQGPLALRKEGTRVSRGGQLGSCPRSRVSRAEASSRAR